MRFPHFLAEAAIVMAIPGLAAAGPQGQRGSGLKFYSASVSGGVDIVSSRSIDADAVEQRVFTLIPTAIAYGSQSRRGSLQFIYEPEIDVYYQEPDLSAVNHAAAIQYSRQFSRDFRLRTGATFLRTNDRSREGGGLVVAPRGPYTEGRVFFAASYRINNDTSVGAQVASRATETDVLRRATQGDLPPAARSSDPVDSLTTTLGVSLSRSFGSTHQLSVSYARLLTSFLSPDELRQGPTAADREGQDSVTLGYTLNLRSGFRLTGTAGTIRLPQSGRGDQYTYSWSGRATQNWGPVTFGGGYRRSLSGLFQLDSTDPVPVDGSDQIRDPLLSRNVAESVDISLVGQLGSRLTISHQIRASRTFLEASDDTLESIAAFLNVAVAAGDRVSPFVSLWYWEQNALEFIPAVSRLRLTGGFSFAWDPVRRSRSGGQQENLRSILPARRGR